MAAHEELAPRTENLIRFARSSQGKGRTFADAHSEILDMVPATEFLLAWKAGQILGPLRQ